MKILIISEAIKIFIIVLFIPKSFAHWDSAYFRYSDDGFNSRSKWMSLIRDSVKLSELAIPGTHDSASWTVKTDHTDTQCINFENQLKYGIRFFDIGVRHISDGLTLHRGHFYLSMGLNDFLDDVNGFLDSNPTEIIIIGLKQEKSDGGENTRSMSDTLDAYLNGNRRFLREWKSSITVGEARGKFIIMSNFWAFDDHGLNYNNFYVQDDSYLTTNWDLYGRWESIWQHLSDARSGDKNSFYINYLSGYGGSFPYFVASGHTSPGTGAARLSTGQTTPGWKNSYPDFPRTDCFIGICTIAFEGTNILTRNKISEYTSQMRNGQRYRTVGIIVADFPGDSLISKTIDNNHFNLK